MDDAASLHPSCFCELDQDGQCLSCKTALIKGAIQGVEIQIKAIQDMRKAMAPFEIGCVECRRRYADVALSHVISRVHQETIPIPRDTYAHVVKTYIVLMRSKGINAFPHTIKAWKEVCAARGWDGSL